MPITVNDKGCVESSNLCDVAAVYNERATVFKRGNISKSAFDIELGRVRDEAFREILKTIIRDNAVYAESSGNLNLVKTIRKIFNDVEGKPLKCCGDNDCTVEECVTRFRDGFKNWIGEWHEGAIIIQGGPPVSSAIIKDRAKLIDFLLFFNYKQYGGATFEERIAKFDDDLRKFGFTEGALYIMKWLDFCVRAAFKLAKDGENVYKLFHSIYTNTHFNEIITRPATVIELAEYETFTDSILEDFDNINAEGSINDPEPSMYKDASLTLYQFVNLHRLAFDRPHLSSYKLWCDIISKEKLPEYELLKYKPVVRLEDWEDADIEESGTRALEKFAKYNESSKGKFDNIYQEVKNEHYSFRYNSVSKENLTWAMILFLNSKFLKGFITRSDLREPEVIADKIFSMIDGALKRVGMSSFNGNFSEAEFLLVNAIYHIDYKKVYNSKETDYPFREYVLSIKNSAV